MAGIFGTTGSLTFPMAYDFNHDSPPGSRNQLTKRKCWGSFTRLEKCLWIFVVIIATLLIGLAIATTIIGVQFAELKHRAIELGNFTTNATHPYPGYNQCLDTDCILTAARMKNIMDESINPCDDFYTFACGGWIKRTPIPVSAGHWGQFDIMRDELTIRIKDILEENPYIDEKDDEIMDNRRYNNNDTVFPMPISRFPEPLLQAQQFYEACKGQQEKASITMQELLDFMSVTFQIRNISFDISAFGKILGILRREITGDYIFRLSVGLNETNTTHNVIYLDQPSFPLDREALLAPEAESVRQAYLNLTTQVWSLVFPNEASQAATIARDILNLEIALANSSMSSDDRRNKTVLYNPMTLNELINITRNPVLRRTLNWEEYFEQVFKILLINYEFFGPDGSNDTLSEDGYYENTTEIDFANYSMFSVFSEYFENDHLIGYYLNTTFKFSFKKTKYVIRDVPFFENLAATLNRFRVATIMDYLHWRVLFDLGKEVNGQMRQLFFQFEQQTQGILMPQPIWKDCIERTNYYFGMAISYRYVEKYFDQHLLQKAKTLVSDILSIFLDILREVDWLDVQTRRAAIYKAKEMKVFIGYPDWIYNITALNKYYHGLDLSSPENHFYNMIDLDKWQNKKNLAEILKLKDSTKWITDPTVVNAFYSPTYNSINFPAGILQPPFYTMPLESLNYGAMGAIIGHEITHGYDSQGSQNDAEGNLRNWWDEITLRNYLEKAACFVEQYSNYNLTEVKLNINGKRTLSENIADNGGVRQAFLAYKRFARNQNVKEKLLPGLSQYNSEQLFFLSYGQIMCESATFSSLRQQIQSGLHSPSKFRVNGVMANSKEFAETWGCPQIWPTNSTCELW